MGLPFNFCLQSNPCSHPIPPYELILWCRWAGQYCGVPDTGGQLRHSRGLRLLQSQAHQRKQNNKGEIVSVVDPDGSETFGRIRIREKLFQIQIRGAPDPK
jgi:hypothetical protein